jgi:hypothetical protein
MFTFGPFLTVDCSMMPSLKDGNAWYEWPARTSTSERLFDLLHSQSQLKYFGPEDVRMTQANNDSVDGADTPEILYHYADLGAMLGIADSKALWATDIRYLNDSTEFSYAHTLLVETLREKASNIKGLRAVVDLLSYHALHSGRKESVNFLGDLGVTFIASLSTEGDTLSQWRSYCPSGGYALGFKGDSIRKIAATSDFDLVKCSYDDSEHKKACGLIADSVLDKIRSLGSEFLKEIPEDDPHAVSWDNFGKLFPIRQFMLDEIHKHASSWKHPSFKEEHEWRLVSKQKSRTTKFRTGRSALIPYHPLRLQIESLKVGDQYDVFSEVVVGPCAEPTLAVSSGMHFLKDSGFAFGSFTLSRAPFRFW